MDYLKVNQRFDSLKAQFEAAQLKPEEFIGEKKLNSGIIARTFSTYNWFRQSWNLRVSYGVYNTPLLNPIRSNEKETGVLKFICGNDDKGKK